MIFVGLVNNVIVVIGDFYVCNWIVYVVNCVLFLNVILENIFVYDEGNILIFGKVFRFCWVEFRFKVVIF